MRTNYPSEVKGAKSTTIVVIRGNQIGPELYLPDSLFWCAAGYGGSRHAQVVYSTEDKDGTFER